MSGMCPPPFRPWFVSDVRHCCSSLLLVFPPLMCSSSLLSLPRPDNQKMPNICAMPVSFLRHRVHTSYSSYSLGFSSDSTFAIALWQRQKMKCLHGSIMLWVVCFVMLVLHMVHQTSFLWYRSPIFSVARVRFFRHAMVRFNMFTQFSSDSIRPSLCSIPSPEIYPLPLIVLMCSYAAGWSVVVTPQ